MEENDAALRTVPLGRGLEHVHEPHERDVEAEHRVLAAVGFVAEEVEAHELLLVVDVLLGAVRNHHVVHALKRVARHVRPLADDRKVLFEAPLPGEIAVPVVVLHERDLCDHALLTRVSR